MPIKYKYDSGNNIVYTYGIGEVTPEELKEYFEKVLNDDEIKNGFWEIVNASDVSNLTITFSDCIKLSSFIKRFSKEKNYQGALMYAPNKLSLIAIKLWFALLKKVLAQSFFIENRLEDFQKLIIEHLGIPYTLDKWRQPE